MLPALGLAGLVAALQLLPGDWRELLRYERLAVAQGELWRLLTGNLVHLGWAHLLLNICGLLVMGWLFGADRSARAWSAAFLTCAIGCNAGLLFFSPDVFWVVGLSGALHGLFVVGAIGWVAGGDPLGKWLLLGVAAKLVWEQTVGELPFSAEVVGSSVVTDAHLWGAVAGILWLAAQEIWRRYRRTV